MPVQGFHELRVGMSELHRSVTRANAHHIDKPRSAVMAQLVECVFGLPKLDADGVPIVVPSALRIELCRRRRKHPVAVKLARYFSQGLLRYRRQHDLSRLAVLRR